MEMSRRLDLLLNEIEMNCDPNIGGEECNQFSVDCLLLIQDKLPPIAVEALTVLQDYLERCASLVSVTEMLARCWKYLRMAYPEAPLNDPSVSAIRAVIFPLDAQKHPENLNIVDHLSFFLMLVNNVEPHFAEEEMLLRKHFINCLNAATDVKQ